MTELEDLIRQRDGVAHHVLLMENRERLGEDGNDVLNRLRRQLYELDRKIEAARQTL